jgi:tetratricopeptide (TPR) repeat protein
MKHFPYHSDWWKGIAAAAKQSGETQKRREALITLTRIEADDPAPRKALAEMALADGDYDDAYKYGRMTIHIDVLDAEVHRILGASLLGLKQYPRAITEFETGLELKPGDVELQLGLAETLIATERKSDARKLIDKVLSKDADNEKAKRLASMIQE